MHCRALELTVDGTTFSVPEALLRNASAYIASSIDKGNISNGKNLFGSVIPAPQKQTFVDFLRWLYTSEIVDDNAGVYKDGRGDTNTTQSLMDLCLLANTWDIKKLYNQAIRVLYDILLVERSSLRGLFLDIACHVIENSSIQPNSPILRFLIMTVVHETLTAPSINAKEANFVVDAQTLFAKSGKEGKPSWRLTGTYFGELLRLLKYNHDKNIENDRWDFPPIEEYLMA
jgi:hypothetical protein